MRSTQHSLIKSPRLPTLQPRRSQNSPLHPRDPIPHPIVLRPHGTCTQYLAEGRGARLVPRLDDVAQIRHDPFEVRGALVGGVRGGFGDAGTAEEDAVDFGEDHLVRDGVLAEEGEEVSVGGFEAVEGVYEEECSAQSNLFISLSIYKSSAVECGTHSSFF